MHPWIHLCQGQASKADIFSLLKRHFSDLLTEKQRAQKVTNLLSRKMARKLGYIKNAANLRHSKWVLTEAGQEECRRNNPSCKRKCWLILKHLDLPKANIGVTEGWYRSYRRSILELQTGELELQTVGFGVTDGGVGVTNGVTDGWFWSPRRWFWSCQSCFWA